MYLPFTSIYFCHNFDIAIMWYVVQWNLTSKIGISHCWGYGTREQVKHCPTRRKTAQ